MATLVEGDHIDPLTGAYTPERVNYATGIMLQADDFEAEQTYHRGRLAQLMRHLMGFGTLAGLKVVALPAKNNIFEIKVFFESQSIVFNYESEEKANEAFPALSNFKGTVTQIGNELNINIF